MKQSTTNTELTNSAQHLQRKAKLGRLVALGATLVTLVTLGGTSSFGPAGAQAAPVTALANAVEPSYTIAVAADHGSNLRAQEVLRRIGADRPDFLLSVGDLSYDTIAPATWCQLVKDSLNAGAGKPAGDAYGQNFRVPLVMGNHDKPTFSQYLTSTCLPNRMPAVTTQATGSYGRDYYFNYPSTAPLARFIMASPGLGTNYAKGSPAYLWLTNAIDSARAAGIKWVIVGNHFNHISSGTKGDEAGADFFNLVVSKKVDLLLQGHDHTYQRSKQLALSSACPAVAKNTYLAGCVVGDGANATYTAGKGTVLLINGLGGAETYPINTGDPEAGYFATTAGKPSTGELAGSTRLVITPSSLQMRFVGTAKTTFSDSFTISSAAPTPVLYSTSWTGTTGTGWAAPWAVEKNTAFADIQSNQGRLAVSDTSGAYARARLDAAGASVADAQVSFSYAWNSTNTPSYASVFLRGSGGWANPYRPLHGYGVQISPSSGTVEVQRTTSGTVTTLAAVAGAQKVGTARQRVRFVVAGSTLRLKIWPEGSTEPSTWTWSGTDTAVTTAGRLHLSLVRSSRNVGAKSFTLDDLVLARP